MGGGVVAGPDAVRPYAVVHVRLVYGRGTGKNEMSGAQQSSQSDY
jgi:hypothetical protein